MLAADAGFFYAPNLHGVDWLAVKQNYAPLIAHVTHRADLTYVIGEMIGELNAGHSYVGGGDLPKPERIKLGLLGAQISRDLGVKVFPDRPDPERTRTGTRTRSP